MLGKTEFKINKPRDGRHCDLCGCSFPAVRCDKCNSQIFCLSCDDMYHRHPKRRFHLRKAVDPTPTPQARPVLPMKVSNLPLAPGDPSKMPLPPPRKKKPGKSFLDTFRRGSPSDNSPPLPKKEYSWTDRLGSIKKFMSNRPLPPVPNNVQENSNTTPTTKNDLSFIHMRVDDKPPQLPQRQPKPQTHQSFHEQNDNESGMNARNSTPIDDFSQRSPSPRFQCENGEIFKDSSNMPNGNMSQFVRPRGQSFDERNQWPMDTSQNRNQQAFQHNMMNPNAAFGNPADIQGFGTLRRQTHSPVMVSNEKQGGMHQSASATDLHSLTNAIPLQGMPQYPPYPMNPQIAPHYPYPMYPPYPNYPQYFGNSWANLSSQPPTTDGDFSDQSEASSGRFMGKRHPFHKDRKAKRSQSVMFDRMAYPGQYYPYGPYPPGYGPQPWMPPHPVEAPPSPAGSIRSLNRAGRTRRRRKTVDDDDDDFSISSSPLSRPKSSSSERPEAADRRVSTRRRKSNKSSSSDEDYAEDEDSSHPKHTEQLPAEKNNFRQQSYKRRGSSPRQPSPALKSLLDQKKHFSDNKKQRNEMPVSSKTLQHDQSIDNSNSDALDKHARTQNLDMEEKLDYHSSDEEAKQSKVAPWIPSDKWQCKFCTFINAAGERICQVCCKTAVKSTSPIRHSSIENIARKGSVSSRKSTESPEIRPQSVANESSQSGTEKRDMALLNSALDEAEKEINRGLEEFLKINDETPAHQPTVNTTDVTQNNSSNVSLHTNNGKSDDTNVKLKPVAITPPGNQNATDKSHTVNENDVADKQHKTNMSSIATSETQTSSDNIDSASNIKTTRSSSVSSALSDSSVSASSYNQKNAISYKISEKASSPLFSRVGKQRIVPASLKESIAESQLRKDSSCQTQQDTILEFLKRKKAEEIALSNVANQRSMNGGYQYPYGRHDVMSPTPQNIFSSPNERGLVGGYGMMHRSHSRASLFGGRLSDAAPATHEYGGLGFGLGPSNMYRSLSRPSLTCDSSDSWVSEFPGLHKPDYYLSMEELVERRRQETMRAQGLELVRMIREAEQQGFTADDIQVALNNCGKQNPVVWLQDNWKGLIDTVVTLSTNYGIDKKENDIGVVCENEARDSLRLHKGNIWASVTECVEGRQRKFLELGARGNFTCKEIIEALTSSEGNVEMAYAKLTKTSLKPFLMRIWGTGEGAQNQEGALPRSPSPVSFQDEHALHSDKKDIENTRYEEFSDQETWEDDEYEEEEVAWEEEPDEEVEEENLNDMNNFVVQSAREICVSNNANSLKRNIHKLQTPESDPSDYCDAFGAGLDDHNLSSSIDEIYLVGFDDENDFDSTKKPETKRKGTSFLSKLAALRKEMKSPEGKNEDINKETTIPHNNDLNEAPVFQKTDELPADDSKNSPETSEQTKNFSPFSILKQTFSAIKDSVTGASTKSDKSSARSISERRTIVVHGRVAHESLPLDSSDEVASLTSCKILPPEDDDELLPPSDENNSISNTEIEKIQTTYAGEISIENKKSDIVLDHMSTIISSKDSDIKLSINEENVSVNNTVDKANFPDKSSSLKSDGGNNDIRKKQSIKIETKEDINEKSHSNFYLDTKPKDKIDSSPVDISDNCNEVIHKSIHPDSVSDTSKIFNKALELNVAASSSKETLSIVKDVEKVDANEILDNKKEVISESDFADQKSSAKVAFVENLFVPQNEIHAKIFLPEAKSTPNLNLVSAVSKDESPIINNQKKNSENSLIDQQYSSASGDHEKITLPDEGVKTFTEVNAKTSFPEQTLLQETIQSELKENVSIKENDTGDLAHSSHSGNIETLNENFKYTGAKDLTPKNTNSEDEVSLDASGIKSNSLLHTPSQAATNVHLNSESIAQQIIKTATVELKAKDNLPDQIEAGKIVENKHNVGFESSPTSSKNDSKKEVEKNNIADIPVTAENEKNKLLVANVLSNPEESRPAGAFAESRDTFLVRINTNSNANTSCEDTKKHLESAEDNVNASSLGDSEVKPSDADVPQSVPKKKFKRKKISKLIIGTKEETPVKSDEKHASPTLDNVSLLKDDSIQADHQNKADLSSSNENSKFPPGTSKTEVISNSTEMVGTATKSASIATTSKSVTSDEQLKSNSKHSSIAVADNLVQPNYQINTDLSILTENSKLPPETSKYEVMSNSVELIGAAIKEESIATTIKSAASDEQLKSGKKNASTLVADDFVQPDHHIKADLSISNENLKLPPEASVSEVVNNLTETTDTVTKVESIATTSKSVTSNEINSSTLVAANLNNKFEFPYVDGENSSQGNLHASHNSDQIEKSDLRETQSNFSPDSNKSDKDTLSISSSEKNAETMFAQKNDDKASSAKVQHSSQVSEPIEIPTNYSPATSKTTANSPIDRDVKTPVLANEPSSSPLSAIRNPITSAVMEESNIRSPSPIRSQSPFGRMTLSARREAIAQERYKDSLGTTPPEIKPWFLQKAAPPIKQAVPKKSLKQQLEFERKVRKLVSDRKCRTYRKAEIVVQLMDMKFEEDEAIQAASECSNLEKAISYLQQECLLCTGRYPVGEIISMVHCSHKACKECIKAYFTIQIRDRTIVELLCPFCNEPDIGDEDIAQDYFNHLDIMLKKLVDFEIHELFQRKLRDRVLMKDPNFRWCSVCSSGFIADPNLRKLMCPDCNAITCANCRRLWEREHEGISCEAYAAWKDANDPGAQVAGLAKLLIENGIDCPSCHFRYALAKGGCMHFRCIQCQHDFCSGCYKPFKMGQKCGVSEFCGKLGLHAHHPRNCLFYLRDKDPEDLQRLLDLNEVEYNKDPPDGMEIKSVCQVMEQKETSQGLEDDICGKEVLDGYAGLCRLHYVEYLGQLVNIHKVDPIQIFDSDDLELVLRRASIRLPAKKYRESPIQYRENLLKLIEEELPLDKIEGS